MKRIVLAILLAAAAIAGCSNMAVQPSAQQQAIQRVCWLFGGKTYCPPADGSSLVLPCESASSVYERPIPILPPAPQTPEAKVIGTIAPTDAHGRPMKAAEVCGQYGCTGVNTPAAIVQYPAYQPPVTWWVQEPIKACAKVIEWGTTQGYGPWGLPSGPPLRGHHR